MAIAADLKRSPFVPGSHWAGALLLLLVWTASSHLFAWAKVEAAGSIEGFALVNDRTPLAWAVFHAVHQRPWLWVLAALVPIAAGWWCCHRRYGPFLGLWIFVVVALPLVTYSIAVGYLGGKILDFGR